MSFQIATLTVGAGQMGICAVPGRSGRYSADLAEIESWAPDLVVSMTESAEMSQVGADSFSQDLDRQKISWLHLPVADFDVPGPSVLNKWEDTSDRIRTILHQGGRVLVHCFGGCGRSGMIVLRVMVEMGEEPRAALHRLRLIRPCAVETDAQERWAVLGASAGTSVSR